MNRLKNLLLACAIVPLSQIALQPAARAEEGNLLLAQADAGCQPGDPNCVPPEQVVPQPPKEPEAQPEPPAPQPEAEPAPKPDVQPEAPAPEPEARPEPEPRPEAEPERREPAPEAPAREPEARPETQPEPSVEEPKAQSPEEQPEQAKEPAPRRDSNRKREPKQAEPAAEQPQVSPETGAPEAEQAPPTGERKPPRKRPLPPTDAQPDQPTPEAQPDQPVPEAKPDQPTPEAKPDQPTPEAKPVPEEQPKSTLPTAEPQPPTPAPQPQEPTPDAGAPAPQPPAQPGEQPLLPQGDVQTQAPPASLIEKLGSAAAAAAVGESVDQRAVNLREVQRERRVISDEDGVRITVEPGGRVIVQSGDDAVIRHDDRRRFDRGGRDFRERETRDGGREIIVTTRDGGEIRTVYDPNGMMIQRERRDRDGRVYILFDNRSFGPGPVDEPEWQQVVRLPPPPVYDIPRERYRVEMRSAPPMYVEEALTAPPLVEVQPEYTLDQVVYSPDLRERVRSVDLDSITFPSGAWEIDRNQVASIEAVARGIEAALSKNPNEVFLVEGYTDAVGSVVDNLSLSDRRAEAVANALSDHYDIPPENLVTQGYGEKYLKVQTEGPERANRRVTVRRITPLLSTEGNAASKQ